MNLNKTFVQIMSILLITLVIGTLCFIAGTSYGVTIAVKKAVDIAPLFMNISINEDVVYAALFQYKNNIGSCAFVNNASTFAVR